MDKKRMRLWTVSPITTVQHEQQLTYDAMKINIKINVDVDVDTIAKHDL